MIRKPTEKDFRDGVAVTVLRETKRTAVESGNGLRQGTQTIARLWLYGMWWFGILATALPAMFSGNVFRGLILIGFAYIVQTVLQTIKRKMAIAGVAVPAPLDTNELFRAARQQLLPQTIAAERNRRGRVFKLNFPIAMRQALKLGLPGVILLALLPIYSIFLLIPSLVLIGTAVLILLNAFRGSDIVTYDQREITVSSLLSKGTLTWDRVVDIAARAHSRRNLMMLFVNGVRHVIVVSGMTAQGEMIDLNIPLDLLDLDKDQQIELIADLIACRTVTDAIAPLWRLPELKAQAEHVPGPASDPRDSFDPDAIIARHLAERTQLIEQQIAQREAIRPRQPASFGRKRAA